MMKLILISILLSSVIAQPFQRLTSAIASSNTQVLNPVQSTSPYGSYSPDQLGSSTLSYPQGLGNQLNIPNVNLQGLSPATFTDPFAPQAAAAPATSNTLSSLLPAGVDSSINSLTSPLTSQTSPVSSTLSNLFGPSTTTSAAANPFNNAPATNTNLFPIDSNSLLFPSSFNSPVTQQQTSTLQAPAQLTAFSQQAPTIVRNNGPQAPVQPSLPAQPSAFNPAAINGPAVPNTPDFTTQLQAARPSISNNSPFAVQSPNLPQQPNVPSPNAPAFPSQQQPNFPSFPSGPVLLESGSSNVRPSAVAVARSVAPVVSSSSSLSSSPPFPSVVSLPSLTP